MAKAKLKVQSVTQCEAVLAALEVKRAEQIARGVKLPELRRAAAFSAHTGNAQARAELDHVHAEVIKHANELDSIADGVAFLSQYRRLAAPPA